MPGIRTVALRAFLRPAQVRRLRRLSHAHHRTNTAQLLHEEPPPGRGLKRDLELPTDEPLQEPAHASPIRRRDPTALHLAGIGIQPISSDLRSMLVKSHYDAHKGPPQAPRFERLRGHAPRLS